MGIELDWNLLLSYVDARAVFMAGIGVAVGVVGGSIPGITISLAMALALPFTLALDPVEGLALLIGIYKGGAFGGSISAILFNVPGAPASAATAFDGYPLTRNGTPRRALKTALWSSVAADVFSDIVLIVTFAPLALLALRFGSRELFAMLMIAMVMVGALGNRSVGRAAIGTGIGLLLAAVGRDPILGTPRLDFGIAPLLDGIGLVPMLIGLFAVSEMMMQFSLLADRRRGGTATGPVFGEGAASVAEMMRRKDPRDHLTVREWLGTWRETATGAVLGTFIGALPGPGGTLATFTAYGVASRYKRNRGHFGTGDIRGVAAAESGNSATSGATLIPLFGLGVPGDALAAIMAAALSLQGYTPGPSMARDQVEIVYAFFILLMIASMFNLVFGRVFIPFFTQVTRVPMPLLVPVLTLISVLGIYSLSNSPVPVFVALATGVLGFVLRRNGVSLGIVVLAFIVGPLLEVNLRRSLIFAGGDLTYFFKSPIAVGSYLVAIAFILYMRRSGGELIAAPQERIASAEPSPIPAQAADGGADSAPEDKR